MKTTSVKFKSFRELSKAVNATGNNDGWLAFLKDKGHTLTTFSYLPEHLQTSLKFSFAKKVSQ